ncbi:MAG: radical SAM protein [Chloroflexota bacterium]|nr:radical SAM protein [Chloroflexota bacterium]
MSELFNPLPKTNLPIFYKARNEDVFLYAPGFMVCVEKPNWEKSLSASSEWQTLQTHAEKANEQPCSWHDRFTPVSLNVYITRSCNLHCRYCFSDPSQANPEYLAPSTESIIEGARLVAKNCSETGIPMTLVLNGGGEPTLDSRIVPLVSYVKELCNQENVPLFTYLATNGIMSTEKANKVCALFDLIGLSCDGPPEIQDLQRPTVGGGKSSTIVERTVAIFHHNHQKFEARVTLTKKSWPRMISIANYLVDKIHPQAINVELAYRTPPFPINEEDLEKFIKCYFEAKDLCKEADIPWHSNSIRPGNHHRQYCHILQNTLQVIPGDIASMCFLDNDYLESSQRGTQIAVFDQDSKKWVINHTKITANRKILIRDPEICKNCFISSHCHRSCPDICPLNHPKDLPDIHCKLNRRLFNDYLERSGNDLAVYCKEQQLTIAGKEIYEC